MKIGLINKVESFACHPKLRRSEVWSKERTPRGVGALSISMLIPELVLDPDSSSSEGKWGSSTGSASFFW
jgi:hypothetical protein